MPIKIERERTQAYLLKVIFTEEGNAMSRAWMTE